MSAAGHTPTIHTTWKTVSALPTQTTEHAAKNSGAFAQVDARDHG